MHIHIYTYIQSVIHTSSHTYIHTYKQSFWINSESEQFNSVSHFCLIAGVQPLDCGYRVVGSLLLLLAMSEIIPGSAGTLGDCRMSQFIHYV